LNSIIKENLQTPLCGAYPTARKKENPRIKTTENNPVLNEIHQAQQHALELPVKKTRLGGINGNNPDTANQSGMSQKPLKRGP